MLGCIRKQAGKAMREQVCKTHSSTDPLHFSSCLQVPALTTLDDSLWLGYVRWNKFSPLQIVFDHSVLGMYFYAPPKSSKKEWIDFRLLIITGYCYLFICLYRKYVFFAMCSLPLGLYTAWTHENFTCVTFLSPQSLNCDALNKFSCCMRLEYASFLGFSLPGPTTN